MSTVNTPLPPSATVVESGRLVTTTPSNALRPQPSMFTLLGLRSSPFWTSPNNNLPPGGKTNQRIAYGDEYVAEVVDKLEASYKEIKKEYMEAVMGISDGGKAVNTALMEGDYDANSTDQGHKLHKGSWDWHSYVQGGVKMDNSFRSLCPKTASIIDSLGTSLFSTPFSYVFFSTLHPGTTITPHSSAMNLRLRVHLPLIVPEFEWDALDKVGLECGGQKRVWEEGKAVVLDDSYVHHVWNNTTSTRVVLLVDIWHPDVTMEERKSTEEMFEYTKNMGWMK
eukprot:CAMPEP_0118659358 /NCGR_PEP_ID=MMETSP0785-20121206/15067_1 /TAXON_ID=91992 /ORGANISM="Bolidomonas pacifica, Strain CCMP 1866" /LENGTH=280 /DNA_ID=CAMNT_0006552453 /DNA_START=297 /DNA_END=1139 /DNA_ORIENTATION=+